MMSVGSAPSDEEVKEMIRIADADGSGSVDFYEFVTLMAHKMGEVKKHRRRAHVVLPGYYGVEAARIEPRGQSAHAFLEKKKSLKDAGENQSQDYVACARYISMWTVRKRDAARGITRVLTV